LIKVTAQKNEKVVMWKDKYLVRHESFWNDPVRGVKVKLKKKQTNDETM